MQLGNVTVDGTAAYIDSTGVHIDKSATASAGITLAQLQQTVNSTLGQDGVNIRLLDPQQTTNGRAGHRQLGRPRDCADPPVRHPIHPGRADHPNSELGNVGLPAGDYTMTTSITFGLAEASVDASAPVANTGTTGNTGAGTAAVAPTTQGTLNNTGTTGNTGFGFTGGTGSAAESLAPTATGSGAGTPAPESTNATAFPINGIPPPLRLDDHRVAGVRVAGLSTLVTGALAVRGGRKETIMTLDMDKDLEEIFRDEGGARAAGRRRRAGARGRGGVGGR